MPGGINLTDIGTELGKYIKHQQSLDAVRSWFYNEDEYAPFVDTISKVDGEWPAYHDILTNVVQEFAPVWNELGEMQMRTKLLRAFKQKVNFPVIPAQIVGSWKSFLYREGMTPRQQPISQYIVSKLGEKVTEDLVELSATGVYTPGTGNFGDSMDGVLTILGDMAVNGNPFRIPLPVITDTNIVGVVDAFMKMLPSKVRKRMTGVFMSEQNMFRYQDRYEQLYGSNNNYDDSRTMRTRFGNKPIIGLPSWDGSDMIMSTINRNWVKLIDVEDAPRFTDVQVLDYKLKLFMEFTCGYEFWMDEAVALADFGGITRGLASNHSIYYPQTATSVIPVA